jgi:hypothetical protein
MTRSALRVLVAGLAMLSGCTARTSDVSQAFRATVTEVVAPAPLPEGYPAVGDTVTGRFRYDPTRPGKVTETTASYHFRPPGYGLDVDLPSQPRFAQADLVVALSTNFAGSPRPGGHLLLLSSEMRSAKLDWPFEVSQVRALLTFRDDSGRALSSLEPPRKIELSRFDSAELRVIGAWPPGASPTDPPVWYLAARLDALEPFAGELQGP